MSKNIVFENEKFVYYSSHFFDKDFKPVTVKTVNGRKYNEEYASETVIFCPKCHKMHSLFRILQKDGQFIYTEKEYPFSFFIENYGVTSIHHMSRYGNELKEIRCPSCGEDLTQYKFAELMKAKNLDSGQRVLKSMKVFDPADDKLVASVFSVIYFPNTNVGKIAIIPIRYRIVFNYKTGQTYFLQGRTLDNKHPKFDSTPEITNVTLGGEAGVCMEVYNILKDKRVVAGLAEEVLKLHGGQKEQLTKNGDFSDTKFGMISIFNNIPYFSYEFYQSACNTVSIMGTMGYRGRRPRDRFTYRLRMLKEKYELKDAEVFQKYLFKGIKIKVKKSLRKEIFKNPFLVDGLKFVCKCGFRNYDVIRSFMLDGYSYVTVFMKEYEEQPNDYKKIMLDFFKVLIKEKGEAEAYKAICYKPKIKISNSYASTFRDTALMYAVFEKRNMMKSSYLKGNVQRIHDSFVRDYIKVKQDNVKINYDKKLFELNDEIDGFKFGLARDTYELVDIGQFMHICVGSYGKDAASGATVIVKMEDHGEYVGCIELSPDGKRLRQAKACFNNLLQEKKAEALKTWIEKHKIDASKCYDYFHIASDQIDYNDNEIYQGHHDYVNFYVNVGYEARRILNEGEEVDEDDWNDLF